MMKGLYTAGHGWSRSTC